MRANRNLDQAWITFMNHGILAFWSELRHFKVNSNENTSELLSAPSAVTLCIRIVVGVMRLTIANFAAMDTNNEALSEFDTTSS